MTQFEWHFAEELEPKGYCELNNGTTIMHGPVKSLTIDDDDMVVLELEWAAVCRLNAIGMPQGEWQLLPGQHKVAFPNHTVPFEIEDTPEKGQRIRFGLNIIYVTEQTTMDPAKLPSLPPNSPLQAS